MPSAQDWAERFDAAGEHSCVELYEPFSDWQTEYLHEDWSPGWRYLAREQKVPQPVLLASDPPLTNWFWNIPSLLLPDPNLDNYERPLADRLEQCWRSWLPPEWPDISPRHFYNQQAEIKPGPLGAQHNIIWPWHQRHLSLFWALARAAWSMSAMQMSAWRLQPGRHTRVSMLYTIEQHNPTYTRDYEEFFRSSADASAKVPDRSR